jgi:hypothetical protein
VKCGIISLSLSTYQKAKCGYCSSTLSTSGGSLNNLKRHLKTKHCTIPLNTNEKRITPGLYILIYFYFFRLFQCIIINIHLNPLINDRKIVFLFVSNNIIIFNIIEIKNINNILKEIINNELKCYVLFE